MPRIQDHDRVAAKPYLIAKEDTGDYVLILRETRYNSQNYPLVKETPVAERFGSAAAARAYAKAEYGAIAGEFATRPAAAAR